MSYRVDSYGNAYFTTGVSVGSIPATTGTQAKVLVPGVNGRISSATVAQLVSQAGGSLVSSVFGRTGAVVAKQADYNTDLVTEGQALYFTSSRARKSIYLTTFNTSGPATYDSGTGILNIPQYGSGGGSVTNYVPLTRTISINGQTADLSVDRVFSVDTIPYPSIGIPLSNGTSWGTSIANNSANWNTAYGWGNHAGLYSLLNHVHTIANITGLQTALDGKEPTITAGTTSQYWRGDKSWQTLPIYILPTASTTVLGGVKVDGTTITINGSGVISGANTYVLPTATSTVLGGVKIGAGVTITSGVISVSTNYEPPIIAGTTAQYWRGDKSWQTLPIYTLAGLGGLPLAGGIMTGAITLKEGAANGLKFPNDVFGGSGDTAGMRLIARSGEAMSLEIYLTNDADDWFNISVPSDNGAKVNGNTIWHASNLTNLNQLTNGPGYITSYVDTNTWDANSRNVAGYVAAPGAVANKVWKTDASGNPAWRDDADTVVTSLAWTSITGRPTNLSSFTNDLGNYGNWYSEANALATTKEIYSSLRIKTAGWFVNDTIFTGLQNTATGVFFASKDVGYYDISSSNISIASLRFFTGGNQVDIRGYIYATNSNEIGFLDANGSWRVRANTSGVTLFGASSCTDTFTATAFFESSDIRYKDVIETNPNVTLDGLDVIKFTRKGNKIIRYGYSAQQVKSLSEDLVGGTKDELTVNYSDVHTLKIAALEKRIAELEAKLK